MELANVSEQKQLVVQHYCKCCETKINRQNTKNNS